MPALRRAARIVILVLLLGAALNVAVAWAVAIAVEPSSTPPHTVCYRVETGRPDTLVAWLARAPGTEEITLLELRRPPRDEANPGTSAATPRAIDALDRLPSWFGAGCMASCLPGGRLVTQARGWPLRALAADLVFSPGQRLDQPTVRWGIALGPTVQYAPTVLPLRPVWPGFLVNTLLLALLPGVVVAAPAALRRWQRRRRGRCARCGYDLRGHTNTPTRCPECGTVPPQAAT
jgi:hypothetical protein